MRSKFIHILSVFYPKSFWRRIEFYPSARCESRLNYIFLLLLSIGLLQLPIFRNNHAAVCRIGCNQKKHNFPALPKGVNNLVFLASLVRMIKRIIFFVFFFFQLLKCFPGNSSFPNLFGSQAFQMFSERLNKFILVPGAGIVFAISFCIEVFD